MKDDREVTLPDYEPNGYRLGVTQLPNIYSLECRTFPQPRLKPDQNGVVYVPAFTDFKLHDICDGPDDPNVEPLDMHQKPGIDAFFAGNRKFITRKLWGVGNLPPYYHHGQFTTMREAVLAHSGEALSSRQQYQGLSQYERDSVIEFLKTLQVLPSPSGGGISPLESNGPAVAVGATASASVRKALSR